MYINQKSPDLHLDRNTGVAGSELRHRDLPVVLGALWTRQLTAFDFAELWLNRILKSNVFHRCLHLITSF